MTDQDLCPESGPMMRWPLAAGLVLVVLMVLFVGGVILARRAQQGELADAPGLLTPVASETTPLPSVTSFAARAISVSTPAVDRSSLATAPTPARPGGAPQTPEARPTPAPSARSGAAPAGTATSVATPGGEFSLALVNGTPRVFAPGQAPVQPTPEAWYAQVAPVDPALANQLQDAYLHFWQVRAQALLDLDTRPLGDVMTGDVLQREIAAIDRLRDQDLTQQIDVQHHLQLLHATAEEAALVDEYISHVVPIDRVTSEALAPSPETISRLAYHFRKLSGTWKVVEAVQLEYE